jgi:putative ABC transport system permease protein
LEIQPSGILSIYAQTDKADSQTNCTQLSGVNTPPTTPTAATSGAGISLLGSSTADPSFASKCQKITIPSSIFEDFYQSNRVNWYGQTGKPGRGEIVSCFKCGDINLREQLGVSNPQDMVGKTLRVELNQAPNVQIAGSVFDVTSSTRSAKVIKQSPVMELKIVAVVDDRNSSGLSLSGSASNNFYVDNSYFTDAVKLSDPSFDLNKAGYIEYNIFLKNYNSLENVSNNIRGDGYVAFSLVEGVVNGVKVAFLVLAGILAAFGFIALIASLFGIVNVMIISVLERQKQIGILKALGSRDRDIFNLFLLESMFLGVLGWLLGSLAAVFSGFLINVSFNLFIQSNSTFKANLNNLNISDFSPSFPWWSFVGTLAISVFFTSLAGVYPASKASKQNPVEVLRSE